MSLFFSQELPNWTLAQDKSPPRESPATVHVCEECGMDFPQKQQLEEQPESRKTLCMSRLWQDIEK